MAFTEAILAFHPIKNTLLVQDWEVSGGNASQFWLAILTMLYVDILDCTGKSTFPVLARLLTSGFRNIVFHGKVQWGGRPRYGRFSTLDACILH